MISICMTTETQQTHHPVPLTVSVKCLYFVALSYPEVRGGALMFDVALRNGNEVRAISVCLFKWIHLTLTGGVIIAIIGDSCLTC